MLSNLGITFLSIALLSSFFLIYFSFVELKFPNNKIPKKIFKFSFVQMILTLLSFFTLMVGYIFSDFSLINVYENSHTTKPLLYKVSGVWGNHEGSLLLWINVLVIFSFLFYINNKKDKNFQLITLFFQNILIFGFLVFLITSSPTIL